MAIAWRITKRKHARTAFSGEGARLYGGRWNTPGTPIVYVAQSQALAVLEMLIHLDTPALLEKYILIRADFDESLVAVVDRTSLPKNWSTDPIPASVQAIGDRWAAAGASVALRVPSTLAPNEFNFLLNPAHPDFDKVAMGKPIPYRFDPRFTAKR